MEEFATGGKTELWLRVMRSSAKIPIQRRASQERGIGAQGDRMLEIRPERWRLSGRFPLLCAVNVCAYVGVGVSAVCSEATQKRFSLLVDCYEWIDESESERSLIMQVSAARRTVEESSYPEMGRSQ